MMKHLLQKNQLHLIFFITLVLFSVPNMALAYTPATNPANTMDDGSDEVVITSQGVAEQQRFKRESADTTAPPAWAQDAGFQLASESLQPFGVNLFEGRFTRTYHDELNAGYVIMPGDQVAIKVWGAMEYNEVQIVDQQGNIFIPEIGPVLLGGVAHNKLSAVVKENITKIFSSNVEVYTNLMTAQPVAVYVAGYVHAPGRYAGTPTDSILFYLDNAGGIDGDLGSYRDIEVIRDGVSIASADLYKFILRGVVPFVRLQDGDTILVNKRKPSIAASGLVRKPAFYEFVESGNHGADLMSVAQPLPGATNVSVVGTRGKEPVNFYISIEKFADFELQDNDVVEFRADEQADTIMVSIEGQIESASRMPVKVGTHLRDLLAYVEVDPAVNNLSGIYIQRKSAATQQKKAIMDSLARLERTSLTATSQSNDEAALRIQEAQLIKEFVAKAKSVDPKGVVVVSREQDVANILLQDGDRVVIPQQNDIILVSGEVLMPRSIVYATDKDVEYYLDSAGGITDKGDMDNIFVARPNGEVGRLAVLGIQPGDQLLVMPKNDFKGMQMAKDVFQILYQIAIATSVVLDI